MNLISLSLISPLDFSLIFLLDSFLNSLLDSFLISPLDSSLISPLDSSLDSFLNSSLKGITITSLHSRGSYFNKNEEFQSKVNDKNRNIEIIQQIEITNIDALNITQEDYDKYKLCDMFYTTCNKVINEQNSVIKNIKANIDKICKFDKIITQIYKN